MPRVAVTSPFDNEFFAGKDAIEVDAGTLYGVVTKLAEIAPGFADIAEVRATFAVDGVVTPDWTTPVGPDCEVILISRVGGG